MRTHPKVADGRSPQVVHRVLRAFVLVATTSAGYHAVHAVQGGGIEITVSGTPRVPPAELEVTCEANRPLEDPITEISGEHIAQSADHAHPALRVSMRPARESERARPGGPTTYRYRVVVGGLEASHRYRYRCGAGSAWSEWQAYETIHAAETYPPSSRPDRVMLTWNGDPATTQSVTWRTDETVAAAVAEIAPAGTGVEFTMNAQRFAAKSDALETPEHGVVRYHSVTFSGLVPDTLYAYRLGEQGGLWSEWVQFRTASSEPAPFAFLYFGDAQEAGRVHFSRVIRQAALDAPDARFMVHAGDLVNRGEYDYEWGDWHSAGSWLNGMIPSIPVVGNHEMTWRQWEETGIRDITPHWRRQFTLPEHGPESLTEEVYYVDFQGVRIIALNSTDADSDNTTIDANDPNFQERQVRLQAAWLEKVLQDNPNRWTILTMHHQVFSLRARERKRILAHWKPLIDKYKVDLVLQGHEHSYGRMRVAPGTMAPIGVVKDAARGSRLFSAQSGTVYVTSVAGPKMYALEDTVVDIVPKAGEGLQLYQVIRVDGDRIRYESKTADGRVYDKFELVKQGVGNPNLLVEGNVDMAAAIGQPVAPADPSTFVVLPVSQLQKLVGEYGWLHESWPVRYVITRQGGQLYFGSDDGVATPIFPVSPDEFVGDNQGRPLRVKFLLDSVGEPLRLSFASGRSPVSVADRIGKRAAAR